MKKSILLTLAGICLSVAAFADKKPLDHTVYDNWQSIGGARLTNNAKFISWQVNRQAGDGVLYIRNAETGTELAIERGTGLNLAEDTRYAICTIKVPYAVSRKAKIDKKKPEDMPKDTLALIDLGKLEIIRKVPGLNSAKMSWQSSGFIGAMADVKGKKDYKTLYVLETKDMTVDTIKFVSSYIFSKNGDKLAYITVKDKKDSLSRSAIVIKNLTSGRLDTVSTDRKNYSGLKFNSDGRLLTAITTAEEEKKVGTQAYTIFLAQEKTVSKATRKKPAVTKVETIEINPEGIPEGWVIGKNCNPRFSNNSERLFLDITNRIGPKDSTVVDFEAAKLDIWVWNSLSIPPEEKFSKGEKRRLSVIDLATPGRILVLANNGDERISPVMGGDADFALAADRSKYAFQSMWDYSSTCDISLVNINDGSRKPLQEAFEGNGGISPYGKYLVYFLPKERQWYSYCIATGKTVCLTQNLDAVFWNDQDDHPTIPGAYGNPSWVGTDEAVLIEDRYDVWKFDPSGAKAPVCLTAGEGRKNKIRFRVTVIDRWGDPFLMSNYMNTIPTKGKVMMSAFSEITKENGFYTADINSSAAPQGFLAKKQFAGQVKRGGITIFQMGDFRNPMDLYESKGFFTPDEKLSAINPQIEEYNWGEARLVHWNAYDGTPLDGVLYTPENLDPKKKYPMIVYFYEKNSQDLYRHFSVSPSRSVINYPFFVSRGYIVFVPDIVYTVGHPGESAYNCICSGAEAMCEQFHFINKAKMGIQGQSWGGYQTAYLAARTDMFAAAGAGAPVSNMTSAYGGIRWGSGNSRIGQYEHGQSRIGKTLWEDGGMELYIENSPVFKAPNVHTPLLIMHNDNDGAVPWYQGIEYFMALRRLGKPCWLLEYNGEAHNLNERRNSKDLSVRLQQFFDTYLKDEPMPKWMIEGVPYVRKGNWFGYEQ